MPDRRKPIHKYPTDISQEPDKYLPSFFLDVHFDNQILKAEIRPLKKDKGFYTVNLNNVFLAHIHEVNGLWMDYMRSTSDIYSIIGRAIEAHERSLGK